jgi:hypothetical protein
VLIFFGGSEESNMKLVVLVATMLVGGAGIASATPLCLSGGTMASYEALGLSGCTIGNLLFSNFVYGSTSHGAPAVPNTAVFLTTVNAGTYSPGPGIVFTSAGWNLPSASPTTALLIDSSISFDVSAIAGTGVLIDDASMMLLTALATGTGRAGVTETITASPIKLQVDANGALVSHDVFPPVTKVSVLKDLLVTIPRGTPGSGSAFVGSFEENFSEVPEPVGAILIGSGLLALGIWRRRRT